MRRIKPLSTSTFRLTLAYLGLFSLSAAIILAVVYIVGARFVDRQLRDTINEEVVWLREQSSVSGLAGLRMLVAERAEAEPNRRAIFLMTDPAGHRIAGNLDGWPTVRPDAEGFVTFTVNVMEDGRRLPKQHDAKARVINLEGDFRLLVGRDINDLSQTQRQMRAAILSGVGMMVVLGLLGGVILSRWMLNRLERINRTTRRIMAGDLGQRIRIDGHDDEFDELALQPERDARAHRAPAGRHAPGQRGYRPRSAHATQPDALAHRGGVDGRAQLGRIRGLLEETLKDADRLIETFNALLAHRARRSRGAACATGSGSISPSSPTTSPNSTSRWPRNARSTLGSSWATGPSSLRIASSWPRRSPTSSTMRSSTRRRAAR